MRKYLVSLFWWLVTIATLFILDDLLFGPVFWAISAWSQGVATLCAFLASWSFGVWLASSGLSQTPSRLANFFLQRLMLQRKNPEIATREATINRQAWSIAGAFLVTPLIGAVIPLLILAKRDSVPMSHLRRLAVPMTGLYAVEFALIHGGYGIGGLVHWITSVIT